MTVTFKNTPLMGLNLECARNQCKPKREQFIRIEIKKGALVMGYKHGVNRDQYKRTVTEDSKLGTGIEKSALGL
jgi:hypothetical protein